MPNLEHIYLKAPPCQPFKSSVGQFFDFVNNLSCFEVLFIFGNQTNSGSGL